MDASAQTVKMIDQDTLTDVYPKEAVEKVPEVVEADAFAAVVNTVRLDGEACLSEAPMQKLEAEYARCMRVSLEELDLEPGVNIHEGSELMSQLRDELTLLPDLIDLSPRCGITDVFLDGQYPPKIRSCVVYRSTIAIFPEVTAMQLWLRPEE